MAHSTTLKGWKLAADQSKLSGYFNNIENFWMTTWGLGVLVTLYCAGGINISGTTIFNSGLSSAGTTTLQTVVVSSSIAIAAGGTCTLPQNTNATQFPSSDPSVAGQLYSDSGTIKRSAG